ncbi:MAG: metallophosphoesterase [Promethearchaeota archaeon]
MIKLLYTTDWHIRKTQPISRNDNFYEAQLRKVEEVMQLCNKLNIDYAFGGGDLFDAEDVPNFVKCDLLNIFKMNKKAKWFWLKGNHDVFGNVNEDKNSTIKIFETIGVINFFSNEEMFLIKDNISLQIRGINYIEGIYKNYFFVKTINGYKNYKILLTHQMFSVEKAPFETLHPNDFKTDANIVLCSHLHMPFEYQTDKSLFINPGTLIRQTIDEAGIEPSIIIFIFTDGGYKYQWCKLKNVNKNVFVRKNVKKSLEMSEISDSLVEEITDSLKTSFKVFDVSLLESLIRKFGQKLNFENEIIEEAIRRVNCSRQI